MTPAQGPNMAGRRQPLRLVRLSKHGKLNARPAIAVIANAEERARGLAVFSQHVLCLSAVVCSVLGDEA